MQTLIHTPTPKLEESVAFYTKLNFTVLSPSMPTLVSDGSVVIEINPTCSARAGLKLYKASWAEEVQSIQHITHVHSIEGGYLLTDTNGVWIYLVEATLPFHAELPAAASSLLGNYVGISIESTDVEKSCRIWQGLGFAVTAGAAEQGWVSCANAEGVTVNIMAPLNCPHLFFNPSLTYFNGTNNPAIIEGIRKAGIPIAEEITHFNKEGIADNIIIRDPGGYGFFVFND